ncbi:hypothetical protein JCM3774_004162 [Rhodotorula dairenensis]
MTRLSSSATKRAQVLADLDRREIPVSQLSRDILDFLLQYPFLDPDDNPDPNANLKFYQNRQAARPRRAKCQELQDELRGNWDELESRHDFVQWFFPIREQGVNWEAQPLQPHEVQGIKADPEAMARLLESYRIMLAFYGLRLVNETTGELALADTVPARSPASYLRRFRNLESNPHNFLRITRILKCLGEFGLERYPPSFLLFILALQSPSASSPTGPHLSKPSLVRSFDNYWRWCVRDDADRAFVVQTTHKVRNGAGWTVDEYRQWVQARAGGAGTSTSATETDKDSDEADLVVTRADETTTTTTKADAERGPGQEQEARARAVLPAGKAVASSAEVPSASPAIERGPADERVHTDETTTAATQDGQLATKAPDAREGRL